MADSGDEYVMERPAKRQKRFTFQRFSQRVAQVDVDVYRRLGNVRHEPLPGSSSFFQEQVAECRELNSTEVWLAVASTVNPLCQSMPLLLHHQEQIVDILLQAVKVEAAISLPPILHVLSCLARDLQQDFLPYLPRVFTTATNLVNSGADRHPELLADVFTCLSNIFKHLSKHVAPQLSSVLHDSAGLLYHAAPHVRQLAADAVGYLFRHTGQSGLKAGLQTVLSQAAAHPAPATCDGAGRVLAAAIKGINNGLHSRAAPLLKLLLQQDVLTPAHAEAQQAQQASALGSEQVHAVSAAVTRAALDQLLHHLRRGKGQVLWECVLSEANARLETCLSSGAKTQAVLHTAARGVAHVAQCVEFFRGSRVEDYQPLSHLLSKLATPALVAPAQQAIHSRPPASEQALLKSSTEAQAAAVVEEAAVAATAPQAAHHQLPEVQEFVAPSLSEQALRLLQAFVAGHDQEVGASQGLTALQGKGAHWSSLFSAPPIREVLPAICGLIRPPLGGPEVAHMFGPQLLAAVGRAILSGDALQQQLGMPLLVELCMALKPEGSASGLPVILTAEQAGVQLAAYINSIVSLWPQLPLPSACSSASHKGSVQASEGGHGSEETAEQQTGNTSVAAAWVAVLCLPHANSNPGQIVKLLQGLIQKTASVLESCSAHKGAKVAEASALDAAEVLFLQCYARGVMALVLEAHHPAQLAQHLNDTLQLLSQHPLDFHAVRCAAEVASVVIKGGKKLPAQELKDILPAVENNLSHPSQAMRCATLRLLCCFEQPAMNHSSTSKSSAASGEASQILPMFLSIQSQTCTVDSGRQAAVSIGKVRTYLEYGQVPPHQLTAVIRCLLGVLHIRFSLLWSPCIDALAASLQHCSQQAWPLLLDQLTTAQASFLAGSSSAATAGSGGGSRHNEQADPAEVPQLFVELRKAMCSGDVDQNGGCTDAAVRLANTLKAMARAPASSLEPKSRDWVPLFIAYSSARGTHHPTDTQSAPLLHPSPGSDPESDSDGEAAWEPSQATVPEGDRAREQVSQQQGGPCEVRVGAKAWRGQLKEWLGFVGGLQGAKGIFKTDDLKQCVVRHLVDTDSGVQQAALRALQVFKVKFVAPYSEQLQKLAADQTLREAMTSFAIGPGAGAGAGIAPQHRAGLVPLLVRLLYPKMRKRSGRLGGKGAPGSARAAILNCLAALDSIELAPLVQLFLQPISAAFKQQQLQGVEQSDDVSALSLFPVPWWSQQLGQHDGTWWLVTIQASALQSMPSRQRLGVLNAAHDLLKHLGHKLKPFLPEMCALVLTLLEGAPLASSLQAAKDNEEEDGNRESGRNLRSSALRFWATVLQRFPEGLDYNCFWPRFLQAVEPQMDRMPTEASSVRAPALLECVAAMAASPALAPVLAGRSSAGHISNTTAASVAEDKQERGAVEGAGEGGAAALVQLGHKLMRSALLVLAMPRCRDASRNATLGVVESLLDLEGGLGYNIIMGHVDQLLESLRLIALTAWATPAVDSLPQVVQALLQLHVHMQPGGSAKTGGQKGQMGRGQGGGVTPSRKVGTRCLAIMEQLAGGVGDSGRGLMLADALMPLLQQSASSRKPRNGTVNETTSVRTLAVLTAVWQQVSTAPAAAPLPSTACTASQVHRYLLLLSPLLGTLISPEARQGLTAAFAALSGLMPDLATPSRLLTALNRQSESSIGEIDYDSSLAAYSQLQKGLWMQLKKSEGLPLMYQCFWDLCNPSDLALRHAAAQALARLLEAAAEQQKQEQAGRQGEEQEGVLQLVQRWMFNLVKKGLTAPNLAVRQEHVGLLRGLVVQFPAQYADMAQLLDKDPELDFFNNMAHLQLHRRQRALNRLTRVLKESDEHISGKLSLSTLLDVVAPVLQQFILEGKAAEDSGHVIKQIDKDREANVSDAAIEALGALLAHLPWLQYEQLLNQWLKVMKKTPTKAVVRAVCTIIDAFHFDVSTHLPAPPGDAADQFQEAEPSQQEHEAANAAAACQAEAESAHKDIQSALTRRVLPSLRAQLVHDGEVVRAPVALAMVKLLKLLPEQAMVQQLPQALQGVAHLLRNRLQRIRDDARNVLVAMMAEIGVKYLFYAIQTLHNACPAKGYTAHVLGYTLHSILNVLAQGAPPGALDGYLDSILPVLEADLFGDIAEAKEADAFAAKYREAKKCKAYDMYQLLACMVTFRANIGQLLGSVSTHLPDASQPKVYNKLSSLLQHASRGILANPTAQPQDLMVFVHGVLEGGLAQQEAAREAAEAEATAAVRAPGQNSSAEPEQVAQHDWMLVDFALGLLHSSLKKGTLGGQAPAALALLDPMLPLLIRALRSRHANSVSLALKCLAFLIRLPLPGLAAESGNAGRAVTSLLQRMSKTGDPIAQDCFKLLATLMRQSDTYQPTNAQLRFLLTWAFSDMEEAAGRQAAFGLLKAVLQRKLVVPEVYDIMTRVQEMMVRSQSAPVRQLCSSVLLHFLLDYPVGDRRLQQHLHFIITNLSYQHETGREAAIDMLKTIINKFPEELVNAWCEVFFLPLVQRLTSDPSSQCREAVGACLRALMLRAAPEPLDKLVQYCLIWLGGGDARLARTAAQALAILVQLEGVKFGRRVGSVLPLVAASLHKGLRSMDQQQQQTGADEEDEAAVAGWQEVYACLLLLERLATVLPTQVGWQKGREVQQLWRHVLTLLAYPHVWIRKAAGRLLGLLLSSSKLGGGLLLSEGTRPGQLALAVYCQLEADVDDTLAAQAVKCLVHLSKDMMEADKTAGLLEPIQQEGLAVAASSGPGKGPAADAHLADAHFAHERDLSASRQVPASREDQNGAQAADSEAESEGGEEQDRQQLGLDGAPGLTLQGLVRRMAKMAGDRTFHRQLHRTWALKFIAALTTRLGRDGIVPYLHQILQPLYRIQESGSAPNSDEIKQLAEEIIAHIRDVAGADALVSAFTAAKKAVSAVRNERKRRAAVQVLVDPEAAARNKLHKQERRAAGRKRKMEDIQRRRGAGVAVKNKKRQKNADI